MECARRRFHLQRYGDASPGERTHSPAMPRKVNRYRWEFSWSTRIRREGGSLLVTIPGWITRRMSLEVGDTLLVKLTEDGIVLRPRFPRKLAPKD
jgi:hypothetical protein